LTVTFHDAARSELSEAVAFYNENAPGLGDIFAAEVRSTVVRILAHPDAGFSVRPMVRRRLLLHFPYSILYSFSEQRLRILAVMHHHREPGYWEDRI